MTRPSGSRCARIVTRPSASRVTTSGGTGGAGPSIPRSASFNSWAKASGGATSATASMHINTEKGTVGRNIVVAEETARQESW